MYSRRLITIDPSLTCSGWALFALPAGGLLGVGKVRAPAGGALAERLTVLQARVGALFEQLALGRDDILICEAPTTMRDPRAALAVEQVRCIFEVLARGREAAVPGRVNPRSVQHEILRLGGRQLCRAEVKAAAAAAAGRLYGPALAALGFDCSRAGLRRSQDIMDALLVGALALARIAGAERAELDLEAVFGERAVARRLARRRCGRAAA